MAGHGGAWKVAFADFMTAMMALFLVLWISAQDKKILIATSQYFQNPFHSPMEDHSGVMPNNATQSSESKGEEQGAGKSEKEREITFLNSVAADINRLLSLDQEKADKPIDVQVTSDGLRITLFDRAKRPLFVGDTAELTEWGRFVTQSMAWLIDRHRFGVTIDGHTRAGYKPPRDNYDAWELSSDRANATRRSLVLYAVEPGLIERVTGYADTKPIPKEPPESESNQRVTLSLTLSAKAKGKRVAPAAAAPAIRAPAEPAPAAFVVPSVPPAAKHS